MAQKVFTVLTDDIDGKELAEGDAQTVSFAIDGTDYEIDLSTKNAEKFRATIAGYVESGRRASKGKRRSKAGRAARTAPSAASVTGSTPKEVRAWARENNYEVPDRGRIPADLMEAYEAAH
jgi:hypothetical protein